MIDGLCILGVIPFAGVAVVSLWMAIRQGIAFVHALRAARYAFFYNIDVDSPSYDIDAGVEYEYHLRRSLEWSKLFWES